MSMASPIEPPPTRWLLPSAASADEDGLVGIGADLKPGTLLAAYRTGLFPMPIARRGPMGWWSPDPRGIVPVHGFIVSRSLRASMRRFEIRVNTSFQQVIDGCADPARPGGWITPEIRGAYGRLHDLGWAHSIEAWTKDGRLAGGLYGVAIGGLFAGESMFHIERDASKVALAGLIDILGDGGGIGRLLDVQWTTQHLRTLGATEVSREDYLELLGISLTVPLPPALAPSFLG